MNSLLHLDKVNKEYVNVKAVNQVSFDVPESCIFGLLGPNGAGKTSLIRIITGITRADTGKVLLMGQNISDLQNPSIGYMPEERGLYKKMKVGEQLIYLCRLKGFSKIEAERSVVHWMKKLDIQSWWGKKVEELSKGMSQKVQFIATVVHKPKLIILDEPFSGLDPINSNIIKDEIIQLKNEGASILFSTHRMEQVEELCEEIVLINKGKVVLSGPVLDIRKKYKEHVFEIKFETEIPSDLSTQFETIIHEQHRMVIRLRAEETPNQVLQLLISRNLQIVSFSEILPTFNDIFIRTVNESNHE